MRLTKYGHACVRVERDGATLVIDPGVFTERPALTGVDAVLITHAHVDHLDVDALTDAVTRRPAVTVHAHPEVAATLGALGDAVRAVTPGDEFDAAGFTVRAYGGMHALNHPDIPQDPNLGFLLEQSVYHPGDSFFVPHGARVDVLLVPVSGPWLKLAEAVDFVRAVGPRRAFGIHDALLSDVGGQVIDRGMGHLSRTDYRRVPPGSIMDISG